MTSAQYVETLYKKLDGAVDRATIARVLDAHHAVQRAAIEHDLDRD